jgi:hypothetical protein
VSRTRTLLVYGLFAAVIAVLFVVFIGFKRDAALVAALSAAGTVAAAGFAALAALGSMRAAAESSETARRSREALARTAQPRLYPSVLRQDGTVHGILRCGDNRAAVAVQAVWIPTDGETMAERVARIDPGGTFTLDLKLPDTANLVDALSMVWIEYWDENRVGRWHDTWRPDPEATTPDAFVQSDSSLVD